MDDQTVVLIQEPDGSWIIQRGDLAVRLSASAMRIVAQAVLRRDAQIGAHGDERPHGRGEERGEGRPET